jgi:hypothetical protein
MDHAWQTALPVSLFPPITARLLHDTRDEHPPSLMSTSIPASQPGDAPFGDDWRTISEELLKGLVHALNNRVAALSAFVELAKLGDEEEDPLTVLPAEIAQLHQVNALFGLLPERRAQAESLELRAVLDDAIRLHEHHPRLRGGQVVVTFEGAPDVVRAPRWALVRVMVMLVHAAKRQAESDPGPGGAAVRVHGDDETISVHVPTRETPSTDLEALVARCGGRAVHTNDELVLTLPSLRELRRREREVRAESPAS